MALPREMVRAQWAHSGVDPPHLPMSHAVQHLKGRKLAKLLSDFGILRKRYWGQHLWAPGYWGLQQRQCDRRDVSDMYQEPDTAEA